MRVLPSWPNHLLEALLPNTIPLVIWFQHINFGEIRSVYSIEFSPSEGENDWLIILCMMSGFPEVFLASKADIQCFMDLLNNIISTCGIPEYVESDRESYFVSMATQELSKNLKKPIIYSAPYNPQSSGQVKQMNHTLKNFLAKSYQVTGLQWPRASPLALFKNKVNFL